MGLFMRDFQETIPYRTPAQRAADDAEFQRQMAYILPQPAPLDPPMPPDVEPPEDREDAGMEALAWWLVAVAVVALLAGVVVWVTA
jgi:hypothetical protein